jgi:3-hydroxymyristoyl/3-hydroxydecanoyl-(acyl carrier protein) dehydratase
MDSKPNRSTDTHLPKNGDFNIGADAISYLLPAQYPLIMIDRITRFGPHPLSITTERYISANEPTFVGHFPKLKLWPGIYTIEGLRQSCFLVQVLNDIYKAGFIKGIIELHKRQLLKPRIDHSLCNEALNYLATRNYIDTDLFSVKVKLLEPVFAGSVIKYNCHREDNNPESFSVEASVDDRLVAKGIIRQTFSNKLNIASQE